MDDKRKDNNKEEIADEKAKKTIFGILIFIALLFPIVDVFIIDQSTFTFTKKLCYYLIEFLIVFVISSAPVHNFVKKIFLKLDK